MEKNSRKQQAVKVESPLLKPSEALTRLQPQTIEDSEIESSTFEQLRYGFELGAIGVLTPLGMVCEVIDMQRIYLLPNAPSGLLGLINLRGNLVPVFNLGELLRVNDSTETEGDEQDDFYMFVLGSDVKAMAFITKVLPRPVSTEQHEPELPPIADDAKNFIINTYSFQQRIWIDFDLEAYLLFLRNQ